MSYALLVDRKAIDQATDVFQYYSAIRKELGLRFAHELDACFSFIAQNPMAYSVRMRDYRHARVKGFNYRVIYAVRGQLVVVYRSGTQARSRASGSGRSAQGTSVDARAK